MRRPRSPFALAVSILGRGRDAGRPAPPARIRTSGITASGSCLGFYRRTAGRARGGRFEVAGVIDSLGGSSVPSSNGPTGSCVGAHGTSVARSGCGRFPVRDCSWARRSTRNDRGRRCVAREMAGSRSVPHYFTVRRRVITASMYDAQSQRDAGEGAGDRHRLSSLDGRPPQGTV
jgi:hypothetical protein